MILDVRAMTGRSPRCEMGTCKNRSTISVGDASARSGLGRLLLCDDCAEQLITLLQNRPVLSPPANEEAPATLSTPEEIKIEHSPSEEPPEASDEVPLEERTRAELVTLATEMGLTFGSKATKTELLELMALHG